MEVFDLNIHNNLASFFEEIEPDEKDRSRLLKTLAPLIRLGPVCETIEGALAYRTNEGSMEWISQREFPDSPLCAVVIRKAHGSDSIAPLYSLLDHVATHLREVSIGMSKPEWGIIKHAYIETRHLESWLCAIQNAKVPLNLPTNKTPTSKNSDSDAQKPPKAWDDDALKELLRDYKNGKTQAILGKQHSVSRQFIGKMLKEAKARFERPRVATAFDALRKTTKK